MKHIIGRYILILGLVAAGLVWSGEIWPTLNGSLITTAEAVVGAPATPVSYAGVARRSTVGAGAPGVGVTPGVGWPGGRGRSTRCGSCTRSRSRSAGCWCSTSEPGWTREQGRGTVIVDR